MALDEFGTTMASPNWMQTRGPEARLDAMDESKLEAVDIRRQQIFNPKIVGSTYSGDAYSRIHAGLTLEAGVRVKNHGGDGQGIMIGIAGATVGGATNEMGYELRPGEEIFLEVDNLNRVVHTIATAGAGSTLAYIGT
tara:strand:- start:667 stop:1080 length:414 start_codon:yes stop_codon:yes gene_type:complete